MLELVPAVVPLFADTKNLSLILRNWLKAFILGELHIGSLR